MLFKRKSPAETLRIEAEAAEGRYKKIAANHAKHTKCSPLCAALCDIKVDALIRSKRARLEYLKYLLKQKESKK